MSERAVPTETIRKYFSTEAFELSEVWSEQRIKRCSKRGLNNWKINS